MIPRCHLGGKPFVRSVHFGARRMARMSDSPAHPLSKRRRPSTSSTVDAHAPWRPAARCGRSSDSNSLRCDGPRKACGNASSGVAASVPNAHTDTSDPVCGLLRSDKHDVMMYRLETHRGDELCSEQADLPSRYSQRSPRHRHLTSSASHLCHGCDANVFNTTRPIGLFRNCAFATR